MVVLAGRHILHQFNLDNVKILSHNLYTVKFNSRLRVMFRKNRLAGPHPMDSSLFHPEIIPWMITNRCCFCYNPLSAAHKASSHLAFQRSGIVISPPCLSPHEYSSHRLPLSGLVPLFLFVFCDPLLIWLPVPCRGLHFTWAFSEKSLHAAPGHTPTSLTEPSYPFH